MLVSQQIEIWKNKYTLLNAKITQIKQESLNSQSNKIQNIRNELTQILQKYESLKEDWKTLEPFFFETGLKSNSENNNRPIIMESQDITSSENTLLNNINLEYMLPYFENFSEYHLQIHNKLLAYKKNIGFWYVLVNFQKFPFSSIDNNTIFKWYVGKLDSCNIDIYQPNILKQLKIFLNSSSLQDMLVKINNFLKIFLHEKKNEKVRLIKLEMLDKIQKNRQEKQNEKTEVFRLFIQKYKHILNLEFNSKPIVPLHLIELYLNEDLSSNTYYDTSQKLIECVRLWKVDFDSWKYHNYPIINSKSWQINDKIFKLMMEINNYQKNIKIQGDRYRYNLHRISKLQTDINFFCHETKKLQRRNTTIQKLETNKKMEYQDSIIVQQNSIRDSIEIYQGFNQEYHNQLSKFENEKNRFINQIESIKLNQKNMKQLFHNRYNILIKENRDKIKECEIEIEALILQIADTEKFLDKLHELNQSLNFEKRTLRETREYINLQNKNYIELLDFNHQNTQKKIQNMKKFIKLYQDDNTKIINLNQKYKIKISNHQYKIKILEAQVVDTSQETYTALQQMNLFSYQWENIETLVIEIEYLYSLYKIQFPLKYSQDIRYKYKHDLLELLDKHQLETISIQDTIDILNKKEESNFIKLPDFNIREMLVSIIQFREDYDEYIFQINNLACNININIDQFINFTSSPEVNMWLANLKSNFENFLLQEKKNLNLNLEIYLHNFFIKHSNSIEEVHNNKIRLLELNKMIKIVESKEDKLNNISKIILST